MAASPKNDPDGVTRKQRVFVEKYLECWNLTKAARFAGYSSPTVECTRLLKKYPAIGALIEKRMEEMKLTANDVMARLGQQAKLNASMFFDFGWVEAKDENGNPVIDPNTGEKVFVYKMLGVNWKVFEEYGYLVKKISYDNKGNPVIEFHDSQTALIQIGKAHRLFVDRVDTTNFNVEVSADELAQARDKAREFEQSLLNGSVSE